MSTFHLPDLGEGLSEAEIREWHVAEGDSVSVDDPLISVETAKAVVEVPSPMAGVIQKCHGKAGDIVATGAPLVEFGTNGEQATNNSMPRSDEGTVVGKVETSDTILHESAMGITPQNNQTRSTIKASPAIRMLAHQLGLRLENITGTGPRGTISRLDLDAAAKQSSTTVPTPASTSSATPESSPSGHEQPLSAVDRYMAELMMKSHQEVVPVTVIDDADITTWEAHEDVTVKLIRAVVAASQQEPNLNAHFDGDHLTRTCFDEIHLGLALDTPEGLFVPVIKDAHTLNDATLRQKINEYKAKALARTLTPDEFRGATIVLSNFGSIGGKYANPIVIPPTVAIIGVGHRFEQFITRVDTPVLHNMLPISLTFDHRAVTGGQASRFIAAMIKHMS